MEGPPYRCPVCREQYDQPFVVCVNCGMNVKSGQVIEAQVLPGGEAEEAEQTDEGEEVEEQAPPPKGRVAAAWIAEYFPGLFRPFLLIFAIILGAIGLGIVVVGIAMVMGLVVITGGVMLIVGSMAWAQAVAMILDGEFSFLVDQLAEFDDTQWTLWFTGLLLPGTILIIIAAIATSGQ